MSNEEIFKHIVEAIKKVLGKSNVDDNFNFTEDVMLFNTGLNFSSIDGVLLTVRIEEIFEIKWPNDLLTFDDINTIGDMMEIIKDILNEEN